MSNKSILDNFQSLELSEKSQAFVQGGNTLSTVSTLEAELVILRKEYTALPSTQKRLVRAGFLTQKDLIKCEIELYDTGGNGDGVW